MKLAITADTHLKRRDETPERWNALEDILEKLFKKEIKNLIIAGDLFDAEAHNYTEFDKLCQKKKFQSINLHIIPGNHDKGLKKVNFTADNIEIYENPTIKSFSQTNKKILLVPYTEEKSMGSILAEYTDKLSGTWILIGHANWAETIRSVNPTEPGVYMPLSRSILKAYQPGITVLGHIHKPIDEKNFNVYYPGSPCGTDITETGKRTFLILDLKNFQTKRIPVHTDILFFDEEIVVYPMEKEKEHWEEEIRKIKKSWDLQKEEKKKTVIRIKVSGYTSDKRRLKNFFEKEFAKFSGWKKHKFDLSNLNSSDNYELLKISERVSEKIAKLDLQQNDFEPNRKQILSEAIKTIYKIS